MNTIAKKGLCSLLLLVAGTVVLRAQPAPAVIAAPTNAQASAHSTSNGLGPRIQFANKEPNFGRVRKGEIVKYTYSFTNTGDRVLHLLNVVPSCGCTHAGDWSKTVEPGKSGTIPIQLRTDNANGDTTKFITVTCDDTNLQGGIVQLLLKGNVWSPIEVTPQFMSFVVPPDAASGSGTVTVTNNTEEPLYLSEPQCSNTNFTVAVKTNAPGRGYQLTITRVPPLAPGVSQAMVTFKTSWTNPPTLSVTAWANVQPPITVIPNQLTLAQAPLTNPNPYTITIQNATTNQMVLSDPAVSVKEVKVEVKELVPGRYFNALLTFPPGFEIPLGQKLQFTVKTGLPKDPVVTVPITQLARTPRPVPTLAPQPGRQLPAPQPPRADAR